MAQLINEAKAEGTFEGVLVDATTELAVELTALDITKAADKNVWVTGNLEYTLVVSNLDETEPIDPVTGVTVEDTIDPTIARLVAGTVEIDGVPATTPADYTYDATTGLLTVNLGNVAAGTPRTITFQVEKVL